MSFSSPAVIKKSILWLYFYAMMLLTRTSRSLMWEGTVSFARFKSNQWMMRPLLLIQLADFWFMLKEINSLSSWSDFPQVKPLLKCWGPVTNQQTRRLMWHGRLKSVKTTRIEFTGTCLATTCTNKIRSELKLTLVPLRKRTCTS